MALNWESLILQMSVLVKKTPEQLMEFKLGYIILPLQVRYKLGFITPFLKKKTGVNLLELISNPISKSIWSGPLHKLKGKLINNYYSKKNTGVIHEEQF